MTDPYDTIDAKTAAIWERMAGDRSSRIHSMEAQREVTARIAESFEDIESGKVRRDIGFHLTDWVYDAAFLLALHLFPFSNHKKRRT